MIETRRLYPAEWKMLPQEKGEQLPTPDQCVAVIAVEEKQAIGRAFLVSPVHVEGIWVEKSKRGGRVMKNLVDGIEAEARSMKLETLFAYAVDIEMEDYIKRLGYEQMPWTVWRKKL